LPVLTCLKAITFAPKNILRNEKRCHFSLKERWHLYLHFVLSIS
jgi:hypothetical protein